MREDFAGADRCIRIHGAAQRQRLFPEQAVDRAAFQQLELRTAGELDKGQLLDIPCGRVRSGDDGKANEAHRKSLPYNRAAPR